MYRLQSRQGQADLLVAAPVPQAAVSLDGQGVFAAAGNSCPVADVADLSRSVPVFDIAKAKLTKIVVAPSPEAAVVLQGQGVAAAPGDSRPVAGVVNLCRDSRSPGAAEAELADVVAPNPEGAVFLQGQSVIRRSTTAQSLALPTWVGSDFVGGVAEAELAMPSSPKPRGCRLS